MLTQDLMVFDPSWIALDNSAIEPLVFTFVFVIANKKPRSRNKDKTFCTFQIKKR